MAKVETDKAREELLKMGPKPEVWPLWPLLPVKSRTKKVGPFPLLGYVMEEKSAVIKVYGGDIFQVNQNDPVIATYETWDAMANDGWVVD